MASKALLPVALLLFAAVIASAQPYATISDLFNTRRDLKFLKQALIKAELFDLVNSTDFKGTLFAPKDVAWTRLAKQMNSSVGSFLEEVDDLTAVLAYHASPQTYRKADLLKQNKTEIMTLNMQPIIALRKGLKVQLVDTAGRVANIDKFNIPIGDNIIVHVIDQILVPVFGDVTPPGGNNNTNTTGGGGNTNTTGGGGNSTTPGNKAYANLLQAIQDFPEAKAMRDTVGLVGKGSILEGVVGNCTVFIPTEKAFMDTVKMAEKSGLVSVPIDWNNALIRSVFGPILQFHIVPDKALKAADLTNGQKLVTLLGASSPPITVSIANGVVTVQGLAASNTARVVKADVPLGKCVGHLIDGVLVPMPLPGM